MACLNDEQRKIVATAPMAASISTPATPSSRPDLVGSKIKLNLPTFDGNPANWTYFWSRFEQVIQAEKGIVEPLKVSALVDAMKDSKANDVAERAAQDGYAAVLDALKTTYNLPRLLFPIHWEGISHQPKPVCWDKEDIDNLKSKLKHHYAGLKAMGVDTFQHVAAYYAVSSFDKRLLEHWQNYLGVGDNPPTSLTFWVIHSRRLLAANGYHSFATHSRDY